MIAFGVAIADPESYERYAAVGIGRSAEPDAAVLVRTGFDSIQEPYNSILEEAAELDGLEALVLLHEDTEILDAALAPKVREGLAVPGAELLGPIGARGVRGLAWWQAETFGRLRAPAVTYDGWFFGSHPYGWHEVESLDGFLLVLSPWAVRELRFDTRFARDFHGYDIDLCFEARARGARCLVAPIAAIHYGGLRRERTDAWRRAEMTWQRKWSDLRLLAAGIASP
jgi:GT2 family glycosyltransferase